MRNGEDIVNKKTETSVDYFEVPKHEKELVFYFGPETISLWWSKLSPDVKVVQSDGDTTFVKKNSAFDTIK